jgi:hypothetical protein
MIPILVECSWHEQRSATQAVGTIPQISGPRWSDLVIGLDIAATNADAASEVFEAAREKHRTAEAIGAIPRCQMAVNQSVFVPESIPSP